MKSTSCGTKTRNPWWKAPNRDEFKERIADIDTFLREQPTEITKYDESLVRRLIEKANIYEDRFTVEFKSNVTVGVRNKGDKRILR
jgi:site-specific DNA recombinase